MEENEALFGNFEVIAHFQQSMRLVNGCLIEKYAITSDQITSGFVVLANIAFDNFELRLQGRNIFFFVFNDNRHLFSQYAMDTKIYLFRGTKFFKLFR